MTRTISWKKGMRLSAESFMAADGAMLESVRQAVLSAMNGRYGLYRADKPFDISLNIASNIVMVSSFTCHALTKNGTIVDIDFGSSYTNTFDTRVAIPSGMSDDTLYLVLRMHPGEWRTVDDTYSEAKYSFELLGENSPIDDNCLPVAAIVNQFGWRMKEDDFVPPCISIDAHPKYMELWRRAVDQMSAVSRLCASSKQTVAKTLLAATWHSSRSAQIKLEKEKCQLSPESFLGILQAFIADFNIGCEMDDFVSLENPEPFELYSNLPLNKKTVFNDIERGISLCAEIALKVEAIGRLQEEEPAPAPNPMPKTKSVPQPDPDELRRRRWAGKEI